MKSTLENAVVTEIESIFPLLSGTDFNTLLSIIKGTLFVWLLLEALFWLMIECWVGPRLQKIQNPYVIEGCPMVYFRRILDTIDSLGDYYPIQKYIEGFCNQAKLQDIYLDNLRAFLTWAMFGKHIPNLNDRENQYIKDLMKELHRRYEVVREMRPGFNPQVNHCSFTLEPVPYIHRPLLFYILAGFNEFVWNSLILRTSGYCSMELNSVGYWIKYGPQDCPQPPLLFFHGISPGWSLYLLLIKLLGEERTVILVDFDPIKIKSMNFFSPSVENYTEGVRQILKRHSIRKVSVIGHSFGSITSGWFVRRYPELVCHITFIDPVSLLLQFPEVAFSFLYRQPSTLIEWVIYLAAAREITISYALRRNFCWHKNTLYLEDIPKSIGVVIGLAGNDEITCPSTIAQYAKLCNEKRHQSHGDDVSEITCKLWPGYSHGQILLSWNAVKEFKRIINASEKLHVKKSI